MYLQATRDVLTPDLVRKAFNDIGWLPPFSLMTRLQERTTAASTGGLAALGNHPSLNLRRQSLTGVDDDMPQVLTTTFILAANTKLGDVPANVSKVELWKLLKEVAILSQAGLADNAQRQQRARNEGTATEYLGAKSHVPSFSLTALEWLRPT